MWLSKRVHCFVLLLYLLPSPLDGKGYQWLERTDFIVTSQKLAGHVLWERHDVHTVLQCAMSCKRESLCESYNYYPEKNSCELNDGNREDHGRDMVAAPGVLYYGKSAYDIDPEAVGPCGAHPCKNGGRCVDVTSTSGERNFICMCPSGWTGRTCTDTRAPLVWSDWGDWSACTVTCGGGYQKRVRACVEHASGMVKSPFDCRGPEQEQQICGQTSCPRWTDWSEWGTCSTHVTCGYGQRVRSHTCTNGGIPGAERGCRGDVNQTSVCREPGCDMPLKLVGGASVGEGRVLVYDDISTTWGSICPDGWNKMAASLVCKQLGFWQGAHAALTDGSLGSADEPYYLSDVTCKGGESSLQRCHHTGWRDVTCSSAKHAAVQCIVDGSWGAWSVWGECSATCAEGHRTRTRTCSHPPSLRGGKLCEGENVQHKDCVEEPCPVDAHWRPWSEWSTCDLECGGGTQQRDRSCQEGKYGGASCAGASEETRDCNTHKCPIDGVWQEWTAWDECSVTCENGTQHRTRVCTPPLHDGQDCLGESSESQTCWEGPCPVDGAWSSWSMWLDCNLTCGGGMQSRSRQCSGVQHGGEDCEGEAEDHQQCNTQNCPVDGFWHDWSTWSACSQSCGPGRRSRERNCSMPLYGGAPCIGNSSMGEDCFLIECPVLGEWTSWESWSDCSATCAGGTRIRHRECNMTSYGDLTAPCEGQTEEQEDCNQIDCTPVNTCAQWVTRGLINSAYVEIKPNSRDAFHIWCDISGDDGRGVTVVHHQNEFPQPVRGFEGAGEYEGFITYRDNVTSNVIDPKNQIGGMVDVSEYCEQFISWRCFGAAFNSPAHEPFRRLTYWENRAGRAMKYWGGATQALSENMWNDYTVCACSVNNSCADPDMSCNCDVNLADEWREDSGLLTTKEDLPVSMLRAGDTGELSEHGEWMVGPLYCRGEGVVTNIFG